MKQVLHSEGAINIDSSGTAIYQYHLKDHLGNVRVVVAEDGTELQQSAYCPFGMQFNNGGSSDNKYLYNGKELQDDRIGEGNLDWYDYGARFYDAALGRFHMKDPLCEYHYNTTPYHYVFNNPVRFIDPLGLDTILAGGVVLDEVKVTAPKTESSTSNWWSWLYWQPGGYYSTGSSGGGRLGAL